jgi:hypothetical protein
MNTVDKYITAERLVLTNPGIEQGAFVRLFLGIYPGIEMPERYYDDIKKYLKTHSNAALIEALELNAELRLQIADLKLQLEEKNQ